MCAIAAIRLCLNISYSNSYYTHFTHFRSCYFCDFDYWNLLCQIELLENFHGCELTIVSIYVNADESFGPDWIDAESLDSVAYLASHVQFHWMLLVYFHQSCHFYLLYHFIVHYLIANVLLFQLIIHSYVDHTSTDSNGSVDCCELIPLQAAQRGPSTAYYYAQYSLNVLFWSW